MKKKYDKIAEGLEKQLRLEEEIQKLERRFQAEKCYKEWYERNNLVYNPHMYGQVSYVRGPRLKQLPVTSVTQQRSKSEKKETGKVLKQRKIKTTKTNDRNVALIPLHDWIKS